jgi:hypothetical protein
MAVLAERGGGGCADFQGLANDFFFYTKAIDKNGDVTNFGGKSVT